MIKKLESQALHCVCFFFVFFLFFVFLINFVERNSDLGWCKENLKRNSLNIIYFQIKVMD